MKRETRYFVLKLKDVYAALTPTERNILDILALKIEKHRKLARKRPLNCVVVEDDWSIYEDVWNLIEVEEVRKRLSS